MLARLTFESTGIIQKCLEIKSWPGAILKFSLRAYKRQEIIFVLSSSLNHTWTEVSVLIIVKSLQRGFHESCFSQGFCESLHLFTAWNLFHQLNVWGLLNPCRYQHVEPSPLTTSQRSHCSGEILRSCHRMDQSTSESWMNRIPEAALPLSSHLLLSYTKLCLVHVLA